MDDPVIELAIDAGAHPDRVRPLLVAAYEVELAGGEADAALLTDEIRTAMRPQVEEGLKDRATVEKLLGVVRQTHGDVFYRVPSGGSQMAKYREIMMHEHRRDRAGLAADKGVKFTEEAKARLARHANGFVRR